jgi:AraC-like DNA-binding protein
MQYREYRPVPSLVPFVERLWTLVGPALPGRGEVQPVLPDGRPELVVHFGDPFLRVSASGTVVRQARVLMAGQLTEQLLLQPSGKAAVLGVRFSPFGAAAFLSVPQNHLAGLTIGIDEVSRPLARGIARVTEQTGDVQAAVPLIQSALLEHMRPESADSRVQRAAQVIARRGGAVSIDALAAAVELGRRHLERRFLATVGIAPKRLARITRFQRALQALERFDGCTAAGTLTAASCGYADQAHFTREFRELAGCSPSQHLVRRAELTGFFVTAD